MVWFPDTRGCENCGAHIHKNGGHLCRACYLAQAQRKREAKHIFRTGTRVRVNESFPYGYHGRTGTVIFVPVAYGAEWIRVLFDDNSEYPAQWHRSYFDAVATDR